MLQLSLQDARTVLCLGAYADDIEIGCGGTVLAMLESNPGVTVHWHVFSGTKERSLEARRSAEEFLQQAAVAHIEVHEFRDSFFPSQWQDIKERMEAIRECQPDVIFTHHANDLHQDHRVLGELTRCAFRDQLLLEYEIPKYDGDLGQPNIFAPLSHDVCRRKTSAIISHYASQQGRHWFNEDLFLSLLRIRGVEIAAQSGFAEAFHARKLALEV